MKRARKEGRQVLFNRLCCYCGACGGVLLSPAGYPRNWETLGCLLPLGQLLFYREEPDCIGCQLVPSLDGFVEVPREVPESPDDDVVERRVLAGCVAHHLPEFLSDPLVVAVASCDVESSFFAELLGLVHLCGSLSAFSGIPRGGFDVDRCPVDGRLPHRLLLSGIFWVRRKAWVRRGGRRILFVNHNQAPIP